MVALSKNQTLSEDFKGFIERNGNFYGLDADFHGIKVVWKEPSEWVIQKAQRDWELFEDRQKAINARTEISEGDFIVRKDGSMERISVASHGWLQAGKDNGSIYLSKSGYGSFSGTCGDSIENYEPTDETRLGMCWIFSGDSVGAHRGVYHKLNFKVWKEL